MNKYDGVYKAELNEQAGECLGIIHSLSGRLLKVNDKLDRIKLIIEIALQTHEPTLIEETRKRYDALLEIRGIINESKTS